MLASSLTTASSVLKSTFTFTDGKLVQSEKKIKPEDHDSVIERYIEDGKLVIVRVLCSCGFVQPDGE